MKIDTAVWWTTMACNFSCDYCWEVQAQKDGRYPRIPFKDAEKWVVAWNRLRPGVIDITGGEPMMIPNFVDILNDIKGARYAITTNLSYSIVDLVGRVSPDRLISVTASYHPMQNGTIKQPMNLQLFTGRCLYLKGRGYNVTVNMVAWPEQVWMLGHMRHYFEAIHGLRFHVDPCDMGKIVWTPTEAESENVSLHQWGDREALDHLRGSRVNCSGGVNHISVQPDGTAWRCILETHHKMNCLGNVFDDSFSLMQSPQSCDLASGCPGCDRDKIQMTNIRPIDEPSAGCCG